MSKKRNFNLKLENAVILLVFMLIISSLLTACGLSTAEISTETKEVSVDKVEDATTEEVAQAENMVDETVEAVESTEEVETFQSAGAWAQSVDRTEPRMTIWNEITKEGKFLENEQKYVLKEGDSLVICTKEESSGLRIHSDLSSAEAEYKSLSSSSLTRFIFNQVILEETLFEVVMTVAGTEYTFSVTLVSEGVEDVGVETNTEDNLIGKEWAATLDYDEVKLLIWNYDTGKKEVVDINVEARIEKGDILAIYCPDRYWVNTSMPVSALTPFEICEGLCDLPSYKCTLLEEISYEKKGSMDLEVELMTESDYEYYNFVVTIQ